MKPLFLLSIILSAFCSSVISQCPQPGLKVQSPVCDSPRNLKVNAINCQKLNVGWKGNKDQTYVVEATYMDAATNTIFHAKGTNISCGEYGNCSATISVKEGAKINWNVQSICLIEGATIHSYKVEGKQVFIPYCQPVTTREGNNITDETIRVYPNPTTGYLTVEYFSNNAGNIQFKIFDMNGKMVWEKFDVAKKTNNSYKLDLRNLLPGSYMLNVNNGGDVSRVKFVLIRN